LQKAALAHSLSLSLQKSLNQATADPQAPPFLLDVLGACLVAESTSGGGGGLGARDVNVGAGAASSSSQYNSNAPERDSSNKPGDADFKPVTTPQLLLWVWESFSTRPEVVAALVRCIGRLAATASPEMKGGGSPATRRLLAAATSVDPLYILSETACAKHAAVAGMSTLALWAALHFSEQARANIKLSPSSQPSKLETAFYTPHPELAFASEEVNKAKTQLLRLLF